MYLKTGNNFPINKGTADIIDHMGDIIVPAYELQSHLNNGLYLASNIGTSIKTNSKVIINTSIGYQYVSSSMNAIIPAIYKSIYRNYYYFLDYKKDEFVQTGYTIIDHQFLVNVGISF